MENLINALLITLLIVDLVYIGIVLFRGMTFQRAIKKKIKEAIVELEKLEEGKEDEK